MHRQQRQQKGDSGFRKMASFFVVPSPAAHREPTRTCRQLAAFAESLSCLALPRLASRPVAVNHCFASVALRLPSRHHGCAKPDGGKHSRSPFSYFITTCHCRSPLHSAATPSTRALTEANRTTACSSRANPSSPSIDPADESASHPSLRSASVPTRQSFL
jgi:hypothetical protein